MTALNRRYYFNSVLIWTLFMLIMIFSSVMDVSQASPSLSSVQPIKEVLDIHQGYDTDLSDPTPFGMTFFIITIK